MKKLAVEVPEAEGAAELLTSPPPAGVKRLRRSTSPAGPVPGDGADGDVREVGGSVIAGREAPMSWP
eukprot:COSAG01_NODE_48809_length_377_cov_8.359712_1_plen_66_part_10